MPASNTSVNGYLTSLPADQRKVVSVVRDTIRNNLPRGYEEMMQGKFISYVIPLSRLPDTYNGHALMYAALAVQKNYSWQPTAPRRSWGKFRRASRRRGKSSTWVKHASASRSSMISPST